MTVTEYLVARLKELGATHLFGVPGDFNLSFLERVLQIDGVKVVGCCNELNAVYAADGFARIAGISALATTYGVGELSAIAGVAGAYAEKVPIVCVNGAPPLRMIESGALVHHTMADGNYNNMLNCYREFTVADALLTPSNAAVEIDRVLTACVSESRPVYIQVPSDVADTSINVVISRPLGSSEEAEPVPTDQAFAAVMRKLTSAQRPAILVDADVGRFKLLQSILSIAEHHGIPIAYLLPAKGLVPEDDPHVVGIYRGAASSTDVSGLIEGADCLMCVGTRLTDVATGLFTHKLSQSSLVDIQHDSVIVDHVTIENVNTPRLLDRIAKTAKSFRKFEVREHKLPHSTTASLPTEGPLRQDILWALVQEYVKPADILVSDTGTAFFASSRLKLAAGTSFVAQSTWAALGYGIPATLGVCLAAPDRRVILFVGDGGLQMSVQEVSSLVRFGLKPIIVLLNNQGYTIERLILGPNSVYNDVHPWDYSRLLNIFGGSETCTATTVWTVSDLEQALKAAESSKQLSLIEVVLPRMDASPALAGFLKLVAKSNFQPYAEPNTEA